MSRTPSELLAALAEPLEPKRPPFYVAGSPRGHPDGWYMHLAGDPRPVFIGRNVIFAERRLVAMIGEHHAAA